MGHIVKFFSSMDRLHYFLCAPLISCLHVKPMSRKEHKDNFVSYEEGQQYILKKDHTSNNYITLLGLVKEIGFSVL